MSETTLKGRLDKEKRQRESSPELADASELTKRRETSFPPDQEVEQVSSDAGVLDSATSKQDDAPPIAPPPSKSHKIDQQRDDDTIGKISVSDIVNDSDTAVIPDSGVKPVEVKNGFGAANGFSAFATTGAFSTSKNTGGFSSLLSADTAASTGFSTLLDANSKVSFFGDSSAPAISDVPAKDFGASNDVSDDEHFEPQISEQQYVAVKGLEKTQVPTGEEGEVCIYTERAKLYAIDPQSAEAGWKERGVGGLRVLKDQAGRTRLVMRADAVLRVILNLPLRREYKIEEGGESMGEKTIRLFGIEDGKGTWLALRVRSQKAAAELKSFVETCIHDAPQTSFKAQTTESNVDLEVSSNAEPSDDVPESAKAAPSIDDNVPSQTAESSAATSAVEQVETQEGAQSSNENTGDSENTIP